MPTGTGSRTSMALAADGIVGPPSGPAGGDLGGAYPNPTVNQASGTFSILQQLLLSGDISDTIAANQDDYNPAGFATASVILIDGGVADRNITGLVGGVNGRIVVIVNVGTTNVIGLQDQGGASVAANRFRFAGGFAIRLRLGGGACILRYNGVASRYECIGSAA